MVVEDGDETGVGGAGVGDGRLWMICFSYISLPQILLWVGGRGTAAICEVAAKEIKPQA